MQICKMNEAYLQLSDEKNRIVQADNQLVHKGMDHITTMMTALQQDLQKRHDVLAANLDPINSPRVAVVGDKNVFVSATRFQGQLTGEVRSHGKQYG
jgi:hypothetical protein